MKNTFLKVFSVVCVASLALAGCAAVDGQDQYNYNDVGQSTIAEFGTVIAVREVGITERNSGAGGVVGATAGMVAGANDPISAIAGTIVGGIIGYSAEQAMLNSKGIEYTITKTDGRTIMMVQNLKEEDKLLKIGQRVLVQTSGSYQRVLPADHLPTELKRPVGIKLTSGCF